MPSSPVTPSPEADRLLNIQRLLSPERLSPYLVACSGDLDRALKLYKLNLGLSESFYGILHGYEIALRNAMHEQLSQHFGQEDWYEAAPLNEHHQEVIEQAKIECGSPPFPVGKVVAELTLGFWTGLTASRYEQSLWRSCLKDAFPHARKSGVGRRKVHHRLLRIKDLRNRVAHHERILGTGPDLYVGKEKTLRIDDVMECLGWICPDIAVWFSSSTRYEQSRTLLASEAMRNVKMRM